MSEASPIKGVKVEIWGYLGEKKQKDELAFKVDALTDEQGHWRCRCFRDMQFAYLYLSHPDYVSDDELPPPEARPTDCLQARPAGRAAVPGAPRLLRRAGHDPWGRGRRRGPRRTGEAHRGRRSGMDGSR